MMEMMILTKQKLPSNHDDNLEIKSNVDSEKYEIERDDKEVTKKRTKIMTVKQINVAM